MVAALCVPLSVFGQPDLTTRGNVHRRSGSDAYRSLMPDDHPGLHVGFMWRTYAEPNDGVHGQTDRPALSRRMT